MQLTFKIYCDLSRLHASVDSLLNSSLFYTFPYPNVISRYMSEISALNLI